MNNPVDENKCPDQIGIGNQIIEIYNPQDYPFGALSNNFYHPITINNKKYDTVTNYVLSELLITEYDKTLMRNSKIVIKNMENKKIIDAIDFLINNRSKMEKLEEIKEGNTQKSPKVRLEFPNVLEDC